PVEDATMDVAVCAEVLEHLDDDAGAVRQLARVLRPGGLLVVTVPAGPHRMDWTDTWAGHRRRYAAPQLTELLRAGGFVRVDVRGWGFPLTGLYHRHVYAPMLRRRVDAGRPGLGGGAPRGAARILRMALELDTPFIGRAPGWFGLLATARRA
ncbi:MAG: methyltransferase domain-containing protein, partial [Thermoleophilia bacterium]